MIFAHAAPKHKKTQCFLILLAPGEQSGAKSVLRDSGSGGGPIGRTTFENIASRAGKTTGFEKN